MTAPFFLGIDIGTQGARVAMIDATGNLIGGAEKDFPLSLRSREEQSPVEWWEACLSALAQVIAEVRLKTRVDEIKSISVTSTSGTVIPMDAHHKPIHHAIMYSDNRSAEEGKRCREAALQYHPTGYTGFNSSSGLSKMVWFVNRFSQQALKISKWIHASDYIIGMLCGRWGITDFTNALKSGYDLRHDCWPGYLFEQLPLQKEWFPEVVAPGTPVGTLDEKVALQLGLKETIQIAAGMTDGCASQIASGAVNAGDWNTTIGTTMVIKGVTRDEIHDPHDRLYNHRHPEGYWMPGGAANIGADWITKDFKDDLTVLNDKAERLVPTGKMVYPLCQQGERFPFIAPGARGFQEQNLSREVTFAAGLEGVAYVERYAYEMIETMSGEKVNGIYTAGGGSNSNVWLNIRASVLNLPLYKMKYVTGAVGAAILAASKTHFANIVEATQTLTQIERQIQPKKEWVEKYNELYHRFIDTLQEKGYINNEKYA